MSELAAGKITLAQETFARLRRRNAQGPLEYGRRLWL